MTPTLTESLQLAERAWHLTSRILFLSHDTADRPTLGEHRQEFMILVPGMVEKMPTVNDRLLKHAGKLQEEFLAALSAPPQDGSFLISRFRLLRALSWCGLLEPAVDPFAAPWRASEAAFLRATVRAFQVLRGLIADGIPGAHTGDAVNSSVWCATEERPVWAAQVAGESAVQDAVMDLFLRGSPLSRELAGWVRLHLDWLDKQQDPTFSPISQYSTTLRTSALAHAAP